MARKLTERQQKFIDALFADANGNIKDAKIIAGYSPNTNNNETNNIIILWCHCAIFGELHEL